MVSYQKMEGLGGFCTSQHNGRGAGAKKNLQGLPQPSWEEAGGRGVGISGELFFRGKDQEGGKQNPVGGKLRKWGSPSRDVGFMGLVGKNKGGFEKGSKWEESTWGGTRQTIGGLTTGEGQGPITFVVPRGDSSE